VYVNGAILRRFLSNPFGASRSVHGARQDPTGGCKEAKKSISRTIGWDVKREIWVVECGIGNGSEAICGRKW
jgi:hypothetical protein